MTAEQPRTPERVAGPATIAEHGAPQSDPPHAAGDETQGASQPAVHARLHDVDRLAAEPDILAHLRNELGSAAFAGPTELVELIFLVLVSRLLPRPLCVIVRAASSAGKSFAVETAMKFAPPSAVYAVHGMSDKALLFTDEPLSHRILVIAEAAGVGQGFMTYGLRELISSARLRYEFTDIEIRGTRTVETEGPTGLILTTTGSVDPELSTRMLASESRSPPTRPSSSCTPSPRAPRDKHVESPTTSCSRSCTSGSPIGARRCSSRSRLSWWSSSTFAQCACAGTSPRC